MVLYIWDCGQNPRLFLKEEKGFGKVHKGREAEGNRSLHQVLQADHPGLKELGYPNERHTLVSWYRGYEEKGEVKDDRREEKRLSHVFSEGQFSSTPSQLFLPVLILRYSSASIPMLTVCFGRGFWLINKNNSLYVFTSR